MKLHRSTVLGMRGLASLGITAESGLKQGAMTIIGSEVLCISRHNSRERIETLDGVKILVTDAASLGITAESGLKRFNSKFF